MQRHIELLLTAVLIAGCSESRSPTSPVPPEDPLFAKSGSGVSLIDLGVLPGDENSIAYSVNDAGQAVGGSMRLGNQRAVFWESGATTPADISHGFYSAANALANVTPEGTRVAGLRLDTDGRQRAVRWLLRRDEAGMLQYQVDQLDTAQSVGMGINDRGQVVGNVCYRNCGSGQNPDYQVALWDAPGTRVTVPFLGEPYNHSRAYAQDVNNQGHVVGFSNKPDTLRLGEPTPPRTPARGFVWLGGGDPLPLPPLDGDVDSEATAISDVNAAGNVYVVGRSRNANDGRPVRWTVNATTGHVAPPIALAASAFVAGNPGVHSTGHVAAARPSGGGSYRAFLWRNSQSQDLGPLKGHGESVAWALNDGATRLGAPFYVAGESRSSGQWSPSKSRATLWKIN